MTIGKRIKETRNILGLTGEDFGKLLCVTKVAVSNWENGNRTPDAEMIVKISKLGNVTTDYLLGVTDIPNISVEAKKEETISPELIALFEKLKDLPQEVIISLDSFIDTLKSNYQIVENKL